MPSMAAGRDTPIASPAPRSSTATLVAQRLLPALILIEIAVLYAPVLRWLVDRWTMSVWHNAHGLFTAALVVFLIVRQLRSAPPLPASSSSWGFAFVVPALALHALDAALNTQLLGAASLILILPGLSLLFLGVDRTKLIAFPLSFAALMLPAPLAFTESLQMGLREVTTWSSASIIPHFGVPVFAEGTTLHLPNVTLLVSDACSGFSTLYAAIVVAGLTAYHAFGLPRKALVLLAAPVIAIAANIVRVTLLSLLVNWHGSEILGSWVHPGSGVLSFALALPIIFWLGGPSKARAPR